MCQSDLVKFPAAPTLFEEYYSRIYRYSLSLMRDPAEADDAAQETFMRAYRHLDSLRDASALTTWLYRIATHVCLDRIRQKARGAESEPETDLDDLEEVDTPSLQQIVERNDMSACVQRYLDGLSDSYRAVILMHDLDGLTGSQMAAALGVSLATVKIRLHRARLRLRTQLEAGCAFSHDERDVLVCEPIPDAQVISLS
ncbi:ECF RNA polymerase sigma factor SigE [Anaerolineae bacterium]|nr:ECF RNA polymerase sigma factor SigE [Anaerolineae bacterium]